MTLIPHTKATFRVARWDGTTSHHRTAHRALEMSRYGKGRPYALLKDVRVVEIEEHKGALNGRLSVESDRYLDDEGREYVQCADGHFEPAESRDSDGRLVGYYTTAVLRQSIRNPS